MAPTDNDRLNLLFDLRKYAEAEKLARELIGRTPDWGAGYTHLARALICQNRYPDAIEVAREGTRKAPRDPWALAMLACALSGAARNREALEPAQEAVRCDPAYPWAYAVLANLQFNLQHYRKARATAITGLGHDPHNEGLLRWKGRAEHELWRHVDALATADVGLTHHPNSAPLHHLRGLVKLALAKRARFGKKLRLHREADASLTEAVRRGPTQDAYRTTRLENVAAARRYLVRWVMRLLALTVPLMPLGLLAAVLKEMGCGKDLSGPCFLGVVVCFLAFLIDPADQAVLMTPLGRLGRGLPAIPAPLSLQDRWVGGILIAAFVAGLLVPYAVLLGILIR